MEILKKVNEIFYELVNIRKEFHMNPELSEREFETNKRICKYLDEWKIEHKTNIAGTGVVAIIRGRRIDKCICARADIDALPILENNNCDYKSQNTGVMHACGHDAHITILLGVAKILKDIESELNGVVKLIFQPAEETIGGAERMIEEGCLENPKVDYIIGLHVQPYIQSGKIELKYGKFYASTDEIKIQVKGSSGHGAYPDKSIDAILIASNIITALQTIVSRNIDSSESVVLSFGLINGGTKNNIIADKVQIYGILRTLNDSIRDFTKERIIQIVKKIAQAYGGDAFVEIKEGYRSLVNDNSTVDFLYKTAKRVIGKDNIIIKQEPCMIGDDFAYYTENVKGAYYHLGCGNIEKCLVSPLHSDTFDIDEQCLKIGVLLQVENILELLKSS